MCTLSTDRYLTLKYPMKYGRNKTKVMVAIKIAFVWLISIGISSPIIIMGFYDYTNVYVGGRCMPTSKSFVVYGSILAYFVPLIINIVTYVLTMRILFHNQKLLGQMTGNRLTRIHRLTTAQKLSKDLRSIDRRPFQASPRKPLPSSQTHKRQRSRLPTDDDTNTETSVGGDAVPKDLTDVVLLRCTNDTNKVPPVTMQTSEDITDDGERTCENSSDLLSNNVLPTSKLDSPKSLMMDKGQKKVIEKMIVMPSKLSYLTFNSAKGNLIRDVSLNSLLSQQQIENSEVSDFSDQANNAISCQQLLSGKGTLLMHQTDTRNRNLLFRSRSNDDLKTGTKSTNDKRVVLTSQSLPTGSTSTQLSHINDDLQHFKDTADKKVEENDSQSNSNSDLLLPYVTAHRQKPTSLCKLDNTEGSLSLLGAKSNLQRIHKSPNEQYRRPQIVVLFSQTDSQSETLSPVATSDTLLLQNQQTSPDDLAFFYDNSYGKQHRASTSITNMQKKSPIKNNGSFLIMQSQEATLRPGTAVAMATDVEQHMYNKHRNNRCLPSRLFSTRQRSHTKDYDAVKQHRKVHHKQKILQGSAAKNERKALKVLGIIFTVFVVFWTPFFVVNIISVICESCINSLSAPVLTMIVWLGYVSSLANPVIYTMFNIHFRHAFVNILSCRYRACVHCPGAFEASNDSTAYHLTHWATAGNRSTNYNGSNDNAINM